MIFTVEAKNRQTIRKSDLTNLRSAGSIPANVYGVGMSSISVAINKAEFTKVYKKTFNEVAFYNIELEGKTYFCVLKERQIHPVTREFLHLDFMVIPMDSKFDFDIPLHFEGEAIGAKSGGTLDVTMRHVKIHCNASEAPESIIVDISQLGLGASIHVRDLPKGTWDYKDNPDSTVIVVHAKRGVAATEDSAV